jgi:subtilase family serine protease
MNPMKNFYGFFVFSVMFILLISGYVLSPVQATLFGSTKEWEAHPPTHIKKDATSSPTGLTPTQIRHAYGFDQLSCSFTGATWPSASLCGNGQVIAIVDAFDDPNIESDLNTFNTQFGLPPCTVANGCFIKSMPQGKPVFNSGWALEISLDVEWAHAIAPGAKILLVEAKNNNNTPLLGAVTAGANHIGVHQVSMSWGGPEFPTETISDSHFKVTGVSFFASSGDSGSGTQWPAVSRFVTGVGGTTLNVDNSGNVNSETAWSGGGGGLSTIVLKPSYQIGFQSSTHRGVPDVSYDGDPNTGVPVFNSNGCVAGKCWIQLGGTSVGAPQWAALLAIVNSGRGTPISSISLGTDKIIYSAALGGHYSQNYRDITSGNNGGCGANCNAATGYDLVTGLGSPLANNLVPFLQTH